MYGPATGLDPFTKSATSTVTVTKKSRLAARWTVWQELVTVRLSMYCRVIRVSQLPLAERKLTRQRAASLAELLRWRSFSAAPCQLVRTLTELRKSPPAILTETAW